MLRKQSYYDSLVGKRQGSITILGIEKVIPKTGRLWRCRCDCGEEFLAPTSSLVSGKRKYCRSCALKKSRERTTKQLGTHLQSGTRLHKLWMAMKSRCHYPGDTGYKYYGGRGICVCEEWDNSFESFRDWALSNGYDDRLSLDRKDCNGDYCPENCHWIPLEDQKYNKRSSRFITVLGETHLLTEWTRIIGVSHAAIIHAEKRGQRAEDYIFRHLVA